MNEALKEQLIRFAGVRWLIGCLLVGRGLAYLGRGNLYRALADLCRAVRVASVWPWGAIASRVVFRHIDRLRQGPNSVLDSYLDNPESRACAALFTLEGGPHDLFRDLIVLKSAADGENGVVLLKYVRTFEAVAALFDLSRLMRRYTFVLEPCWSGYCDPSVLMFIAPGHPVIVQCFTPEDLAFVRDVGPPLVPIALGPADWVDADIFAPPTGGTKTHDIVMVANWARHKRHALLFQALSAIRDRAVRVLLIGFPWAGRTAEDIRREAAATAGAGTTVDVLEKLPPAEVARHVSQCKTFVFLSRKEGDNKALVEAMFADVPSIVYNQTIGGARSRINGETGMLSSDEELPDTIRYMLDHHQQFHPRAWALANTGSRVATAKLDAMLRRVTSENRGMYTRGIVEKTNAPNLAYKAPGDKALFQADYDFILSCARRLPVRDEQFQAAQTVHGPRG
jgi:glycosyltransferase involved in cell wall biosynthesis